MKGKLTSETDRQGLLEYINKLDLSKVFHWEIKKHIKRRTISQNRLERLWLACIEEETGNESNYMHDIFKEMFLEPKWVLWNGIEKKVYTSKDLNTAQFALFLDKIQAESANMGIILPTPDDLIWDSFYEQYKDRA
ncbi:hypothetical protein KAR91_64070 [Candidatus Pacearchaeota archaeon]|nr:hypothetical protein [Candidatus Pacearchaeota archaeon]